MKIVAIDSYGDRPQLREVATPQELAADEILVHIRAAGMNPVDFAIAQGVLQRTWPARFPLTLGSDFAGIVERTGADVGRFHAGDMVYGKIADGVLHQGAYGEYVVVPERGCVSRMPLGIGFADAAALPTAAMTAIVAVDAAHVSRGSRVLVVGATGGVGSFAVQIAAQRGGAVIATAHDEAIAYVKGRGASEVIDYRKVNLADTVRAAHPEGLDALIDLVSDAKALDALSALVKPHGAVVSSLHAANVEALAKRGVRGTNMLFLATADLLARVTKLIEDGDLTPADVRTYPLDRVQEALDTLRSGHVHGKLVLATG